MSLLPALVGMEEERRAQALPRNVNHRLEEKTPPRIGAVVRVIRYQLFGVPERATRPWRIVVRI